MYFLREYYLYVDRHGHTCVRMTFLFWGAHFHRVEERSRQIVDYDRCIDDLAPFTHFICSVCVCLCV